MRRPKCKVSHWVTESLRPHRVTTVSGPHSDLQWSPNDLEDYKKFRNFPYNLLQKEDVTRDISNWPVSIHYEFNFHSIFHPWTSSCPKGSRSAVSTLTTMVEYHRSIVLVGPTVSVLFFVWFQHKIPLRSYERSIEYVARFAKYIYISNCQKLAPTHRSRAIFKQYWNWLLVAELKETIHGLEFDLLTKCWGQRVAHWNLASP